MKTKQFIRLCRFRAFRRVAQLLGKDRIESGIDKLLTMESDFVRDGIMDRQSGVLFEEFNRRLSVYEMSSLVEAVTPFDTRLLFGLCNAVRPRAVLEIGTFIGHSTAFLAAAVASADKGDATGIDDGAPLVTTVDIMDVNEDPRAPWRQAGFKHSPIDVLRELSLDSFVRFHTGTASRFFAGNTETFDLIFIDGEHSFAAALNDTGHALECMAPGGIIALHDYCGPGSLQLAGGKPMRGVFQAARYLTERYPALEVVPLQSHPAIVEAVDGQPQTTLALLCRKA